MTNQPTEVLPTEARICVAHTHPAMRGSLRVFLELDHRLARIVAATTEPMLGQMRLAWWRDMLGNSVDDRPTGDVVLDGIGEHWAGKEAALIALVDGWEQMLAEPPLGEDDAVLLANGRCSGLLAAYGTGPGQARDKGAFEAAAWAWAFADMAAKVSLGEERDLMIRLGLSKGASIPRLPHDARGLAVLGALGLRALKRGGRPLMEGRAASLIATRAAIFGR